jgi:ABC-type Na+ efflux pump permease subunit
VIRTIALVAGHDLLDLRRQRGVWVGLLPIPFVTVSFLLLLPGILSEREQTSQQRAVYKVVVDAEADPTGASVLLTRTRSSRQLRLVRSDRARDDVVHSRADAGVRLTAPTSEGQLQGDLLVLSSRSKSRAALGVLSAELERLGVSITDARLAERDLPPTAVRPFTVTNVDLTESSRGRRRELASLLPLLVLLPVAGIVGVSAQRISGSKDQRVFEPLLVLPFRRVDLLLGKALSSLVIGSLSLVAVGLPLVLGRFLPIGRTARSIELPPRALAGVLALGALLLTLLVVLGVCVGAASRTSAELGSVLQLTTLPIFLLGSFLQFRSATVTTPQLLVLPFFGPLLCVRDAAIDALTAPHVLLAAGATLGWIVLLLLLAARLLASDRSVLRATT